MDETPYGTAIGEIGRWRYDRFGPFWRVTLTRHGVRIQPLIAEARTIAWADVADVREVGPSFGWWALQWVFRQHDGTETWFTPWRPRRFRRLLAQVQGLSVILPSSESR